MSRKPTCTGCRSLSRRNPRRDTNCPLRSACRSRPSDSQSAAPQCRGLHSSDRVRVHSAESNRTTVAGRSSVPWCRLRRRRRPASPPERTCRARSHRQGRNRQARIVSSHHTAFRHAKGDALATRGWRRAAHRDRSEAATLRLALGSEETRIAERAQPVAVAVAAASDAKEHQDQWWQGCYSHVVPLPAGTQIGPASESSQQS